MQSKTLTSNQPILGLVTIFCLFSLIISGSCRKSTDPPGDIEEIETKRKPPPPPPPPPPFYFNNCGGFAGYSGSITAGVPANVSFTLNYVNSPGGSYGPYTSSTVNGITFNAPAGTLNVGSGSITFTATGTPLNSGTYPISVSVGGSIACPLYFNVLNPPANPATCGGEPGAAVGSIGCVTFNYRGQSVTYYTVRAADGKIWLQQNLGSPQVAFSAYDDGSFGHYFQWGRWDDGHQVPGGPTITGGAALQNPTHIPSGNPNFIKGATTATSWWINGASTDTWTGTMVTATNGKDPCAALGPGWRMPSAAEWNNISIVEGITSPLDAYASNLRLPSAGYRGSYDGTLFNNFTGANYWSGSGNANGNASYFFFDDSYNSFITQAPRGYGFPCRCVKD